MGHYVCLLKNIYVPWSETNLIFPLQTATDNNYALGSETFI